MNTISYKDLKTQYLNNEDAKQNAEVYFKGKQPFIHVIGFYSAPSWNWGYQIGIVDVQYTANNGEHELDETKTFEVVTRFGEVVAARWIVIPKVEV